MQAAFIDGHKLCGWIVIALFSLQPIVAPSSLSAQDVKWEARRKALQKVAPIYPGVARTLKLHGTVRVAAKVEADGQVSSAEVMGGHPLLAQAALAAVQKWRYEKASRQTTEIAVVQFSP